LKNVQLTKEEIKLIVKSLLNQTKIMDKREIMICMRGWVNLFEKLEKSESEIIESKQAERNYYESKKNCNRGRSKRRKNTIN
jgi:hypothetical protein